MANRASGPFEVKLTPQAPSEGVGDPTIGRMAIDKTFRGDLEAVGRGQMLAFRSEVEGSAGYVAIERVEGSLRGRSGSFTLQHTGLMTRGAPQLTIDVVPDSGTGGLTGLTGTMSIRVEGGRHSYEFAYSLPETP